MEAEIKTGYVIMSTSTFYPAYYSKTIEDRQSKGFSVFSTEDKALQEMPAALKERDGLNMSIVKTYWSE